MPPYPRPHTCRRTRPLPQRRSQYRA
ncbi:MAG TPA: hypothetical protein DEV68_01465 [Corynebacterium flavescens]|nr:hypothetical protein F4V60_03850 [Corynebacterium flavescens]HCG45655.1 hypothetical protein [Corynebacterium flavescens]